MEGRRCQDQPHGTLRTISESARHTDSTFTGQRVDPGVGLMYYGVRYCDAALVLQREITCVVGRAQADVSDANNRRGSWPLASSGGRPEPTSGRTWPAG